MNGYNYDYHGMTRVSKPIAKKLYNEGKKITMLPCKANPASPWFTGMEYSNESGEEFTSLVNAFEYYNCCSELGRYTAFYVK